MNKKLIFIHIPKTGGTSINCEMNQTEWQTKPDFFYRHIDYKSKKSNSADIFESKNKDQYRDYGIFFFLRDPIERLFSEYYFLKPRKEFMQLLPRSPRSFYEYCKFKNTQNSVIKFLLGHRMYSNPIINEGTYKGLIEQIETLDIKIGIFENYIESLIYIQNEFGQTWSNVIEKKRITIDKPATLELTKEEHQEIKALNEYDYRLYEYATTRLKVSQQDIQNSDIILSGSRYDYIEMYTRRFILIETQMTKNGKSFLLKNKSFFANLNLSLHRKKLKGKDYVRKWNEEFKKALLPQIEDPKIANAIQEIGVHDEDPLQESFNLARLLNNALNDIKKPLKINRLR